MASLFGNTVARYSSESQRSLAGVPSNPSLSRSTWPANRLPNLLIMIDVPPAPGRPASGRRPRGPPAEDCGRSANQAVEAAGVLARHLVGDVVRQVLELLADVLRRLRPHTVGMRIVRAPHERLHAHLVDELGAHAVVLEGGLALPPPVLTGLQLQRQVLVLILVLEVHAVEHVGDPADAALPEGDLQIRIALEH